MHPMSQTLIRAGLAAALAGWALLAQALEVQPFSAEALAADTSADKFCTALRAALCSERG